MGNRLSEIVTRTGDHGTTGMADGSRRAKNDIRVHCLGEVDELNASIGVALSLLDDGPIQQAEFSGLVRSITKKNCIAKTSALRRFIDIVGNEPKKRFVGKLG